MNKIIFPIVFMLVLNGCISPKKTQIDDFIKTMNDSIGLIKTPSNVKIMKRMYDVTVSELNNNIIRYTIKMDHSGQMGGKNCIVYEDVDKTTNRILSWGYVSSPDKCRKKINWLN